MKRLLLLTILFCKFQILCLAQTIENPIFDRSDVPAFRVEKVEITPDTTYVYCTYHAEEHSWACLSDKTYLEDVFDGSKYPIINVCGIPFSPQQRDFPEAVDIQVVLYFPHISAEKFNIIENNDNKSFNVYGIDLKKSYKHSYSDADIETYFYLAIENEKKEKWNDAIDYFLKQLEASKYVYGIQSKEAALPMYSLTMQFAHLREYEKMTEWGKQAIDILSTTPQDSLSIDVLARAYGNVGTAFAMLNQSESAEQFMELSLATRRKKGKDGEVDYVVYLRDLSIRYYYEGDYPKALLYGKEVTKILERKFKEESHKYGNAYVNSLNNLCEFYQTMDQYEPAKEIGKQAIDLINGGACQDSPWLRIDACINLASALSSIGQIEESLSILESVLNDSIILNTSNKRALFNAKLLKADLFLSCKQDTTKAIIMYEELLNTVNDSTTIRKLGYPEYTRVLSRLYNIYIEKDKKTGMNYLEKAIQVQKEWQGENSIDYANILLAYVYNMFEESINKNEYVDRLLSILRHASCIIMRHLKHSFYFMSKSDRNDYWNRYKHVFTWLIPTMSSFLNTAESNSLAYDASLFYKGILLSSEIDIKDFVLSSNDKVLIDMFNDYLQNISLLETQCSMKKPTLDLDSLTSTIRDREFFLFQKISWFQKLCKGTIFSWEEVKKSLKEKEAAIEIVSYNIDSTTHYDAYVITHEFPAPKMIPLFTDDGKSEEHLLSNNIDYENLSKLIWGNEELKEALNGVKNVYVSASGLLNIIGFEYLPIGNDQYIFDKYNIFRLSSTRELCYTSEAVKTSNVYLFGGLDYESLKNKAVENSCHTNRFSLSVKDSFFKRGGFEPLIGSKQEIEQIRVALSNKNINFNVFTDAEGTEDSFKKLSGKQIDLIHLSTHGMYVEDDNLIAHNNFQFIISDENSNIDEETRSLTRSFLVMSGGNKLIQRDTIPEGKEDDILTALEIAHLDFKDLDLVVLSACQTGLGRISSDGVYGLQRGFKKAGANTILMSLDKVDDDATRILMVEFYRNLMNGKTKRQSLQEAQQYLRKVDNGKYDDPKYWASFIMLDGLN